MRLLLLTNEYRPVNGGIATYCHALIQAMAHRGHEVAVVAAAKGGPSPEFDAKEPYPLWRAREHRWVGRRFAERWRVLCQAIEAQRPDWLWASDWRPGLLAALAARRYQLPLVVSAFGSELLLGSRPPIRRHLIRLVMRQAQAIIGISHYTKSLLMAAGVPGERVDVIMPGTRPDMPVATREARGQILARHQLGTGPLILTLARLVPRKGHDIVLAALPSIRATCPNVRYLIAGAGPDRPRLEALVQQLGLADTVCFAGTIAEADKATYYAAADLYVLLSRPEPGDVEGFGITLLEAAAQGLPIVAGRSGGAPDALAGGSVGYLVDPVDVAAVAAAITHLLENPAEAAALGACARTHVEQVANWAHAATALETLLERGRLR